MPDSHSGAKRMLKGPVAWLLSRDLIASLRGMILFIAYGGKLDPREWMQAEVFSFAGEEKGGEFWFDYAADSGDGMTATYSIAYLCMSNLYAERLWAEMPGEERASLKMSQGQGYEARLPRGQFLLVGGDTSYHLSDYPTLASRFFHPFRLAYKDLREQLKDESRTEEFNDLGTRRPLFGIPGNHDYYDQLDGFRRQFRRPLRTEPDGVDRQLPDEEDRNQPQLMIPGFKRCQNASYVALRLPFGWWLWGLDTEVGQVDERQENFFKEDVVNSSDGKLPDKLIVATCAPTTFFGKFADEEDGKSAGAFAQLGLRQPFLPDKSKPSLSEGSGDADLKDGQCRLDLSGDNHLYARYWGPQSDKPGPRPRARAERPSAESYASVVSGLGGAFHHPSQTYVDQLQEQVLYPSEEGSRREVSRRLFNFYQVFNGGKVWLVG
jgi:hypothetical protein